MKANELRIGNLIEYKYPAEGKWDLLSVLMEDLEDVNDKEKFRPIPLTDEWLQKLGFEWKDNGTDIYVKNKVALYGYGGYTLWAFNWSRLITGDVKCQVFIEYVHQLQNLYYALTGQELKFKSRPEFK